MRSKFLANQQKDGDSPVKMVVQEIMDGLRRFVVDSGEAVKVGDLEKNMGSRKVVTPKFTTDFLEAAVREGAGELVS